MSAREAREQNRAGHGVVLGLGEEIRGDPLRIGRRVGDHHDLARPRDHVDAHVAEHPALGQRHVDVARPHDLVHAPDGLRAVGQRGHRLGAADPVGLGHSRHASGGEHGGVERLVGDGRRDEHDLLHARHARRDHRHQARWTDRPRARRGRRRPTRSSGRTSWPSTRAQWHPSCATNVGARSAMKALDPVRGIPERPHGGGRHRAARPPPSPPPSPRARRRSRRDPIEALGELEERRVALVAHGGHDLLHPAMDVRVDRGGRTVEHPGHARERRGWPCRAAGSLRRLLAHRRR